MALLVSGEPRLGLLMRADRLEVWGDPIDHSLSPVLHSAAYRRLGFDWSYGRRRVDEDSFAGELAGLGPEFRGLSCTMPLKAAAYRAATWRDTRAEASGAVNTLLLQPTTAGGGLRGYNTDVGGIVRALADEGVTEVADARIVGAGATATSALVAVAELGARDVEIVARRPAAAAPLEQLGERLGIAVRAVPLDARPHAARDVTVATLPGSAQLPDEVSAALAAGGGPLLDVVYGHGPTALTQAWSRAGLPWTDGLGMLLHQAALQIRIFATGDVDAPLTAEDDVVDVMRRALMGD